MSAYVALYRKYRPGTFAELVGQEPIARTLSRAVVTHRVAHAYLLCGPRGTGKTTVARILAKALNCENGPAAEPCGACGSCQAIASGSSLDVIEIDAASNNGVDNIRDMQDRVALAAVGGRYKVYIIDEVHMLSQGAFNALLKTLEEPPPNVVFVLATTDPHKVLPTIVSRCQRFDFGRIALAPLVSRLAYVADQEAIAADHAALEAIARRANGGLRDALSLLDQLAAALDGETLTAAAVSAGLGLVSGDQILALAEALIAGDSPAALDLATALLAAGHDHGTIVRELLTHFRHLMVLQVAPERAAALEVPTAHLAQMTAQAQGIPSGELPWMLEALNETEGMIRRSPQQAIWLELGLIKLARRPAIASLTELVERVTALEAAMGGSMPLPFRAVEAPRPAAVPLAPAPAQHQPSPPALSAPAIPLTSPAPEQATTPPQAIPAPVATPIASQQPPRPPEVAVPPRPPITSPRPPLAVLNGGASPPPASPPLAASGGQRPLPPNSWERVMEHLRVKSMPTHALLNQHAKVMRWEADGALVLRMTKTFKDQIERAPTKKKLLDDAIKAVFGPDAFLRIEAGDKGRTAIAKTPAAREEAPTPPPYTPPPPPVPVAQESAANDAPPAPAPAVDDMMPPDLDEPPAWLDEENDCAPPDAREAATTTPAMPPARPTPAPPQQEPRPSSPAERPRRAAPPQLPAVPQAPLPDDPVMRLAAELFNGRVIKHM